MGYLDAEVIIAGAGPTGLMLAGELGLAGVGTIVVERLAEPMPHSRALGFSARTIETFAQRGLLRHFGELQTIPIGHFGGLPLDYRVLEGGSYGARGIPQSFTESVLGNWASDLGAKIHRGHEVVDLHADDQGVRVEVTTPDGPRQLSAEYVVGCDGGRSTVRKLAGIDFPGTDPVVTLRVADVAGCQLRPRFAGERVPGGYVMVLPLGPDLNRVVVYEPDAEPPRDAEELSFGQIADAWQRLTGEDIHGGKAVWVSSFTDASRQASEYRRGRIFLAGDAAHVHLPIGGQGISAGVEDATNLGWKLAATINGWAPGELLDTYHTERHPVGARVLTNTLAQRILYLSGDEMDPMRSVMAELLAYEDVRRHLVGMVAGLDIRYDVGPGDHPLLGQRLPGVELTRDSGTSDTMELLRAGRGVLLDLAGDAAVRAAADPWADRVDVVTAVPRPGSAPTSMAGATAVLVRPDGYCAWIASRGSGPEGLPAALSQWFGRPAVSAPISPSDS